MQNCVAIYLLVCLSILYQKGVVRAENPIFPHRTRFAFNGYPAAVEVELGTACGAYAMTQCSVDDESAACLLAVGTCPVKRPQIAVHCHGSADDQSAKPIIEGTLLQLYLRNVHSCLVAECIGQPVLSQVGSLSYANELSRALCLVVGVYGGVENEAYPITRVGTLALASREYECSQQKKYGKCSFHRSFF